MYSSPRLATPFRLATSRRELQESQSVGVCRGFTIDKHHVAFYQHAIAVVP